MDARIRAQVRRRARLRCEYCQFPERFAGLRFQLDHVVARKHSGPTKLANLALACFRCNSHKGPNLSGIDPQSGKVVRLFNPREDHWLEHFEWDGPRLLGLTPRARATIAVLRINREDAVLVRSTLIEEGISFEPTQRPLREPND